MADPQQSKLLSRGGGVADTKDKQFQSDLSIYEVDGLRIFFTKYHGKNINNMFPCKNRQVIRSAAGSVKYCSFTKYVIYYVSRFSASFSPSLWDTPVFHTSVSIHSLKHTVQQSHPSRVSRLRPLASPLAPGLTHPHRPGIRQTGTSYHSTNQKRVRTGVTARNEDHIRKWLVGQGSWN